jgi:hypothetical protein
VSRLPVDSKRQLGARGLLNSNHQVTSPRTPNYNCIAWAYGIVNRKLWPARLPSYWWPPDVLNNESVDAFKALFESISYVECADGSVEEGFEKVAIFANGNGPQHAARQLENGHWTSKLGDLEDIEHWTADVVEGQAYGRIVVYMKRAHRRPSQ